MKIRYAVALVCMLGVPAVASAETMEERQACMNDAFSVCGHAIPDRDRVAACLFQNRSRVSTACRTVLNRYSQPTASRARTTAVR